MKASIDRSSLVAIVAAATAATDDAPYLCIVASGHSLACEAISPELGVHLRAPAGVEAEGSIAVSARTLSKLAAHLPDGMVELEASYPRLRVRFEGGSATLLGADSLVVGELPDFPEEMTPTPDLGCLISQVIFAASRDDGRPALQGVRLEAREGRLYAVASDGHRLALASLPFQGTGACTISRKTAGLLRQLSGRQPEGELAAEGGRLYYSSTTGRVVASAMAYPYPDVWKLLTELPRGTGVRVSRQELEEAVARAAVILTEERQFVSIAATGEGLRISASSEEGEVESTVAGERQGEGGAAACHIRPEYLLRPLRALPREVDSLEVAIAGSTSPLTLRAQQGELAVEHFIMPVLVG
jgi:DNA polymerase-3 subunit beta